MLSVTIVGAGGIGRVRAKSILDSQLGRVTCIADVDSGRAAQLAELFGSRFTTDWLDAVSRPEVDAVVISTPTKFHAEIAIAAMQAGKHVLCEKPLGRTVKECQRMVQTAKETGRILKTGFNYRQMGHVRKAKQLLESGAIGPVYFLRCRYGHGGRPGYEQHWCTDAGLSGGGVLQEQGIHMVDLVRVLLGEPIRVTMETQRYFWPFPEVEDNCFCLFETAAHQTAQIHVSWTQWINVLEVEIFGQDGYLRLEGRDGHYGPQRLTWGKRQKNHSRPIEELFTFEEAKTSWDREWNEFVELTSNNKGVREVAVEGLRTQQLVEAAYRSAREHTWINIPEPAMQ